MRKFIRENLFNSVFRKKQIREQRKKYEQVCKTLSKADEFDKALERCDSLLKMLAIHKDMWGSGFRNKNIGPDDCGMFRTKDILSMGPGEVFLGDIYGLWTFPIPEWENQKNAIYGANGFGINPGTTTYELILGQYRRHLQSNLRAIVGPEKEWLEDWNSQ